MRKSFRLSILTILFAAASYAGGEPWKTKPYTQWDEKDVAAVLRSSPWAKPDVTISGTLNADATSSGNSGVIGSPMSKGTGTNIPQLGGNETPSPAAAPKIFSVYWYSSRTVREAFARRAVLKAVMTPEAAEKLLAANPDTYQILVNSPDMSVFEGRSEDAFKDSAFIEFKKEKKKVGATKVTFQRSAGKVVGVLFSFPKQTAEGQPLIGADQKEVEFSMKVDGPWLRTDFNLKQMNDMQGLDL